MTRALAPVGKPARRRSGSPCARRALDISENAEVEELGGEQRQAKARLPQAVGWLAGRIDTPGATGRVRQ